MKNLQSIDYKIDLPKLKTSGSYLLDKVQINNHCSLVSAIGETGTKRNEEICISCFHTRCCHMVFKPDGR